MIKGHEHGIGWKKGIPTKPGFYLRSYPFTKSIIRQYVSRGNGFVIPKGKLAVYTDGKYIELEKWPTAGKMWWLGPIPDIPENEDDSCND